VLQVSRVLKDKVEFAHLEIGSEQGQERYATFVTSLRKSLKGLAKVLAGRYDILHSNTALNPRSLMRDLVMIAAARVRGKPVLLHVHGGMYLEAPPPAPLRIALGALISLSTQIVIHSERERLYLTRNCRNDVGRTAIIYNGVDVGPNQQHGERLSGFHAVFAGRLTHSKGIQVLLKACRNLPQGVTVTFYGQGPLLSDVCQLAAENSQVKYSGIYTPQEAQQTISKFHVLILPSISSEGMPMTIVEAMSVGTVPVCRPLSSIPEIVQDGATGMLIDSGPGAICNALATLRDAPALWSRMSDAAKAYAAANLNASENYGHLFELYQRLIRS